MRIIEFVLEKYKRLMLSNIHRFELTPTAQMQLIVGSNGAGKAQPLDSWVKIPGGWKTMGQMCVGDDVIAKDGSNAKVTGVFPQGKEQIYRVTFADGRTARATGDHLWSIYHGGSTYPIKPEVMTTDTIIKHLGGRRGHLLWVDLIDAEDGDEKNLPIDPYEMGVILGDECNKLIPDEYCNGSRQQRLALVQGLMDTAGYIGHQSTCSYTTTSSTLADHVAYLIRSLGGIAKITTKGRIAYNVHIRYKKPSELFTLPKKKERANDNGQYNKSLKLRIKTIEPDGVEEAQCISIDHPDKLYVTDNFVVTHNSSILEELTPLPAHHKQFAKGGKKYIKLEHRGRIYTLTSEYTSGTGKHTFQCDDEVLNNQGTFAVQKELAESHFGITREIFDLLIGNTTFTGLSTAKRREWLTRLAPVDLSYAFQTYNHIRSLHRDQLGVIKHITKRMGRENQDLPDDAEVAGLRQQIKQTTDKLDRLFELRQANTQPPFTSKSDFEDRLKRLTTAAKRLLDQHPNIPPEWEVTSPTELSEAIERYRTDYQRHHAVLERMQDEHAQVLQQTPSRDDTLSDADIASLRQQVSDLSTQREQQQQVVDQYQGVFPLVDLPQDRRPRELLQSVFDDWLALLQTFPDNAEGHYSQERGRQVKERYAEQQAQYRRSEAQLNTIRERLARLKGCESIECPQCQHQFQPGVSPEDINALEQQQSQLTQQQTELDKQLKVDQQYLEDYEDYASYVRRFRRLVQDSPMFSAVWDLCLERQVMTRTPRDYVTSATVWMEGMQAVLTLAELRQQHDTLLHRLRYVEAIDRQALSQQDARRQHLEKDIESTTMLMRDIHRRLGEMEAKQREVGEYQTQLHDTAHRLEELVKATHLQRDHLFQQAISEETQQSQMRLAQTQEQLSKIELREGVLSDLQQQQERAQQDHLDYGVLVKSLAPTDGLIGRYLMGFLQGVVKMINAVIAEIWTYPMEVMPSQVEKDELDYKFPLNVNNEAVIAPDISAGSASQRDIINFAFKLLVMKCLKLEDMPLFLDEFGSTFDEQHRLNLIPFLNQMLEMNQIQQLFYISHHAAIHGAFNQAEVCVLDDANIVVPQVYNQHVRIN